MYPGQSSAECGGVSPVTVEVDPSCFSLETVKRAAYRLPSDVAVDIRASDGSIVCVLSFPVGWSFEQRDAQTVWFKRELLDQDLRATIASETAPLRNAILAFVFSGTRLQGET